VDGVVMCHMYVMHLCFCRLFSDEFGYAVVLTVKREFLYAISAAKFVLQVRNHCYVAKGSDALLKNLYHWYAVITSRNLISVVNFVNVQSSAAQSGPKQHRSCGCFGLLTNGYAIQQIRKFSKINMARGSVIRCHFKKGHTW